MAFGLVVILVIGALVGWRLDGPGAKEQQPSPHQQPLAAPVPWALLGSRVHTVTVTVSVTPPSPAASTDTPPGVIGPGWQLAFDADFSGSALDSQLWQTCYPWAGSGAGCTNYGNSEYELVLPGQVQELTER